jgi:hypothetical protein
MLTKSWNILLANITSKLSHTALSVYDYKNIVMRQLNAEIVKWSLLGSGKANYLLVVKGDK